MTEKHRTTTQIRQDHAADPSCEDDDATPAVEETVDQWLAKRKEAALNINSETAEVMWRYAYTIDPYGVDPALPEECRQIGMNYFARSPESDVWVWFGDLPKKIRNDLWKRPIQDELLDCLQDG